MNHARADEHSTPGWSKRITSTALRCHLLGAITAAVLVVCIAWVWSRGRAEVDSIVWHETVVDLNDAAILIEDADQWRQLYTASYRQSQSLDQRAEAIAHWLSESIDGAEIEQELRSAADAAELQVSSVKQGERYVGQRVGVLSVRCDVTGSYASLCRFLNALSQRARPIACSEIELKRSDSQDRKDAATHAHCQATVSLRVPYAASETDSGRLLMSETKHES